MRVHEDYAAAATIEAVRDALVRRTDRLGFRFVSLVAPSLAVALHNYPDAWTEDRLAPPGDTIGAVDPMFDVAAERALPFFWRDAQAQNEGDERRRDLLRRAASFGIADGFSVPIRGVGAGVAAGSVVPGGPRLEPLAYRVAHSEIMLAHERVRSILDADLAPRLGLSAVERDCLALAARGKTDWEIGAVLGLTQRQVHYVIERAKARAGVTTRIQAIVHAFASGELAVIEALRDVR